MLFKGSDEVLKQQTLQAEKPHTDFTMEPAKHTHTHTRTHILTKKKSYIASFQVVEFYVSLFMSPVESFRLKCMQFFMRDSGLGIC